MNVPLPTCLCYHAQHAELLSGCLADTKGLEHSKQMQSSISLVFFPKHLCAMQSATPTRPASAALAPSPGCPPQTRFGLTPATQRPRCAAVGTLTAGHKLLGARGREGACPMFRHSQNLAVWHMFASSCTRLQCTLKSAIALHAQAITGVDLMATNAVALFCRELDTGGSRARCSPSFHKTHGSGGLWSSLFPFVGRQLSAGLTHACQPALPMQTSAALRAPTGTLLRSAATALSRQLTPT